MYRMLNSVLFKKVTFYIIQRSLEFKNIVSYIYLCIILLLKRFVDFINSKRTVKFVFSQGVFFFLAKKVKNCEY